MRLTAEQHDTRRENRIRGTYTISPPRTERRGRKAKRTSCDQCGLETDYLFAGPVIREIEFYRAGRSNGIRRVTRQGLVCQRCRPPSNLEKIEVLEAGYYKGHHLELREGTQ